MKCWISRLVESLFYKTFTSKFYQLKVSLFNVFTKVRLKKKILSAYALINLKCYMVTSFYIYLFPLICKLENQNLLLYYINLNTLKLFKAKWRNSNLMMQMRLKMNALHNTIDRWAVMRFLNLRYNTSNVNFEVFHRFGKPLLLKLFSLSLILWLTSH